jgi:hypothetical protein
MSLLRSCWLKNKAQFIRAVCQEFSVLLNPHSLSTMRVLLMKFLFFEPSFDAF